MIHIVTDQLNPSKPLIPLLADKVKYIILHHVDASKCTWQDINLWHKNNGWSCAGYNAFVTKSGEVYILRGDNVGAQCAKHNSESYGIAVEGNYSIETMPAAQFNALVNYLKAIRSRYKNLIAIVPHRFLYNTTCPGANFPLSSILTAVSKKEAVDTLYTALDKLVEKGIVSTRDYWELNAVEGKQCKGEHVKQLIINMAQKI